MNAESVGKGTIFWYWKGSVSVCSTSSIDQSRCERALVASAGKQGKPIGASV